tara:strand:+ start:730 stop:885 length:156 start_codon:yes stop_codon:yes gene_type:complete
MHPENEIIFEKKKFLAIKKKNPPEYSYSSIFASWSPRSKEKTLQIIFINAF